MSDFLVVNGAEGGAYLSAWNGGFLRASDGGHVMPSGWKVRKGGRKKTLHGTWGVDGPDRKLDELGQRERWARPRDERGRFLSSRTSTSSAPSSSTPATSAERVPVARDATPATSIEPDIERDEVPADRGRPGPDWELADTPDGGLVWRRRR